MVDATPSDGRFFEPIISQTFAKITSQPQIFLKVLTTWVILSYVQEVI